MFEETIKEAASEGGCSESRRMVINGLGWSLEEGNRCAEITLLGRARDQEAQLKDVQLGTTTWYGRPTFGPAQYLRQENKCMKMIARFRCGA